MTAPWVIAPARVVVSSRILQLLDEKRVFTSVNAKDSRIWVGCELRMSPSLRVEPYSAFLAGGMFSTMGAHSYTWSELPLDMEVGRYCSIAGHFHVPGPRHPLEAVSTSSAMCDPTFCIRTQLEADFGVTDLPLLANPQGGRVTVEHDVWIGSYVTVNPGVRIGSGSVIAAHSVVTRDVPPFSVVGGNPARVIRRRFPAETCEALERVAWWDYGLHQLRHLDWSDPARFADDLAREPPAHTWRPEPLNWSHLEADELS